MRGTYYGPKKWDTSYKEPKMGPRMYGNSYVLCCSEINCGSGIIQGPRFELGFKLRLALLFL